MRRRKRERKIKQNLEFGVRSSEFKFTANCLSQIVDWMAQRIIIKRMPNSMREKAHSSIEPKAMGVDMIRKIRMKLII